MSSKPTLSTSDLLDAIAAFGTTGQHIIENGSHKDPADARAYYMRAIKHLQHYVRRGEALEHIPVDIETFIEHEFFLNKRGITWPKIMECLRELNTPGRYVECVLTGGIGTAKTHMSVYTQAYQVYLLSCLKNPHADFNLDPSSEIVIIFQSITAALAKAVDYQRFKDMIMGSEYFRGNFPFDPKIESELRFPKRLIIKPVSGTDKAAIGHNVIGGVIDEMNFMAVIENSRQVPDGNVYDQAIQNYNAIARRRESRFLAAGVLPGMLCLVSSKRYPGQFTDRKMQEASSQLQRTGKTNIFVYDKRVWDIAPPGRFSGTLFKVYVGDRNSNPFVIEKEDEHRYSDEDPLIDIVPSEFEHSYRDDIHAALRDISGISTMMQHAFFTDVQALADAFGAHKSCMSVEGTDMIEPPLKIFDKLFTDPGAPHYAHVDLGAVSDSAGIAITHIREFTEIDRGGRKEVLPVVVVDAVLEIKPPTGGEIDFAKIRNIFYKLRELGMNLKWISYDTWQSRDSLQILRQSGFSVGALSVDRDTKAYDLLKRTITDRRLEAPAHTKVEHELRTVQWIRNKDKIDHLPTGSKDCADALAGAVYGITTRREIWVRAGIRRDKIPVGAITGQEAVTV